MKGDQLNVSTQLLLNDYPLYFEDLGQFHPTVSKRHSPRRVATTSKPAHWMARRVINSGWVVRRALRYGK